jgi:hypothetical protein
MIKTTQYKYQNGSWENTNSNDINAQLILTFGSRKLIESEGLKAIESIKKIHPTSTVISASTAGNIIGEEVYFENLIATAIEFEKTKSVVHSIEIDDSKEQELGQALANKFDKKNLKLVLVYSTMNINAGELIKGINIGFNNEILVSGGVAGDGTLFEKTIVGVDTDLSENKVIAVGLYGNHLEVSHGSKGGWKPFGPPRKVTKSDFNVLYEIDGKPVLDVYKDYLGPKAKDLPGSGLLFPFAILDEETDELIVRGIQGISEEDKSITLYGNIEVGQTLKLMRADHSILVDGAGESAQDALSGPETKEPQLAILVSCVARVLALDQLLEEELEEVQDVLGKSTAMCGFYSYSEFSPLKGATSCSLHNQTMTITTLSEK